ncbi:MAG: 2-hydroxy-3-oxopropionate reductase [Paracoccaceae bacterium]|jgi:3-hydroxyisobutyrate dehydrogenase-like beta-hydroxyacid dehydrogenase
MTRPTIGFIGLGLMGAAIVGRLQDQGYALTITANRTRPAIDAAVARGATEVPTARDVAAASDIIMLCMDTSASVESRMNGPDGVFAGLKTGATVIDFGTSLPASTRGLSATASAMGAAYLDAPLGRTPAHAKDGLLNIMCAGDAAAFEAVQPVLKDIGENVFHLGASGAGHTIKLINNFFGMTVANAMAEALAMADIAGVGRQDLYNVMAAGPLHSGMMDFVAAYGIDNDTSKLAFAIKNAAKDVGYYSQMAEQAGATSRIAPAPLNALKDAVSDGRGELMVCEMVDFYAETLKG